MRISLFNRLLLLAGCLLAGYQVWIGIDGLERVPIIAYTIAFGTLLVAQLLILILGYEALDSPVVVIISTIIPLSLSLGLVWEHCPAWQKNYLLFTMIGFLAVVITRALPMSGRLPVFVLAVVHGIAGMVIFLLPTILAALGNTNSGFALVGLGGALIGLGGLLLFFLKSGNPIVPRETIFRILPGLLLLMIISFVLGFALA